MELFQRGRIDDGAAWLKLMDEDIHHADFPSLASAAGGATRDNLSFIQIPPLRLKLRFAHGGHLQTRMPLSRKKGAPAPKRMLFGLRSVMPTPSENADSAAPTMFRNLSTSTKLIVLCGAFIVAIAVAIYALVAEQQIAIEFAKKELTGVQYIEAIRGVYSRLLGEPGNTGVSGQALPSAATVLSSLNKTEAEANLNTASLEQSLTNTLSRLWSDSTEEGAKSGLVGKRWSSPGT